MDKRSPGKLIRALSCACAALAWAGVLLQRTPLVFADGPVALEEYRRVVAQATTLVDQAVALPAGAQRQALLQQAATVLDAPRELLLPGGDHLTIDNQALAARLRDASLSSTSLQAARLRLHALQDALPRQPGEINSADQQALRDLLAQPPFSVAEADNWLARLIDELLSRLFGGTAQRAYDGRYLLVGLGVLLIAMVITYFVLNLRRTMVGEAVLPAASDANEANLTSGTALANAQRLAVAGDYRSAVRQLYLSTLLLLDERGRLRYDRSLTNREYLRAVAGTPGLRDALRPIVDTFDRIWYGFAPISAGEFAQYQAQVETLQKM